VSGSWRSQSFEEPVWSGRDILYTGVCPLSCSSTLAALVSLSPDSPTEMFMTSFWMRSSRMGFALLSFPDSACVGSSQLWHVYYSNNSSRQKRSSRVALLLATTSPCAPRVVSDRRHRRRNRVISPLCCRWSCVCLLFSTLIWSCSN